MANPHTPAPTAAPAPISRGDKIRARVDFHGANVEAHGVVKHLTDGETFFAQLKFGSQTFNRYLKIADEGETWRRAK